jgi:5'-nucleotidase
MEMITGLNRPHKEKGMRKNGMSLLIHRTIYLFIIFSLLSSVVFGQQPYRILVSNDDGIDHPGTKALIPKLSPLGEITVAAPSKNASGVGHGMTFPGPIPVEAWERDGIKWFSIGALPATCVRLALTSLLSEKPDMVVAGINKGANVGVITFSSGTVACAREAAYKGIPAVAVNMQKEEAMDYDAAAGFVAALVKELKEKGLPPGTYLNVNIPALPKDRIKGVLITKQDLRPSDEWYEKRLGADGKIGYWSIYKVVEDGDPKSDAWALSQGYISITPFSIDQTQFSQIKSLENLKIINPKKCVK